MIQLLFFKWQIVFFWHTASMDEGVGYCHLFLQIGGVSHQSALSVQEVGKHKLVPTAAWLCRKVASVYLFCWLISFRKFEIEQPASARIDWRWLLPTGSRETSLSSRTNWHIPLFHWARTTHLWEMKPSQTTCWTLCNTIFRALYHVESVIQGQRGVGLDVSSNIHFVNVELFYSPPTTTTSTSTTSTSTTDAGTNVSAQMGAYKCPWEDNTSFFSALSSSCGAIFSLLWQSSLTINKLDFSSRKLYLPQNTH